MPFLVDAASYAFSTLSLLAMRTPFEEERERDEAMLRTRLAEGFRFMWQQAFLRTTAFVYGIGNFVSSAILLLVVVIGRRQGLSPGEVGALSAAVGVGTLIGSLASPLFRKALSIRAIIPFMAQIVGAVILRQRDPDRRRPFRMWLYPLPAIVALGLWSYVVISPQKGLRVGGLYVIAAGTVFYFARMWLQRKKV